MTIKKSLRSLREVSQVGKRRALFLASDYDCIETLWISAKNKSRFWRIIMKGRSRKKH